MHRSTSFPSVQKTISVLAMLVIVPAVIFCSITPNAAATDKNAKVPEKAEAIFPNSETLKPLSNRDKAAIDVGIARDPSATLRANEENHVIVTEVTVVEPDFPTRNGVVRAVDMVLLPQPLNRFTL